MSAKSSVQVAIKVRPLLQKEKDARSFWRVQENSIRLVDSQAEPYCFDHIFDGEASNQTIFDKVAKQIVNSAVQGFNGTIFAYGQTSSGKTYTMMGDDTNPGVMVLAAKEIFEQIAKANHRQFLLRIGYIEIYNEKIYDLLNKKNQDLKIHEIQGNVTVNCEEPFITSEAALLDLLCEGNKERTVGETNMNERSSRSHAIFRIIIESRLIDRGGEDTVIQSVLNLVDLAGSERADQTGARGTRLKEGGHINKSLMFLSNVIKQLSERVTENEDDKFISFRDSKLTRILQASLGGNALTAIICTIKPTVVEETLSTINFATRAKSIKNKPQVNETVSDATMMKRLEREIKELKSRLAEERSSKNESQSKVVQLEQRIKNEVLKIISANSLSNIKSQSQQRRRTWCPAVSSQNVADKSICKPRSYYTPEITICNINNPSFECVENEHFQPAETVNFDIRSPERTMPHIVEERMFKLSLTPQAFQTLDDRTLRNELHEMLEYLILEQANGDVENSATLKQKLVEIFNQDEIVESERLEYIRATKMLASANYDLEESEKRSNALQEQVNRLTLLNEDLSSQKTSYERQLETLKQETVCKEYQFESHVSKTKLREKELLELLTEKNNNILRLEKSLISLEELLKDNKVAQMQAAHSGEGTDNTEKLCVKCADFEALMLENEKISLKFKMLTHEYEKLQLNYTQLKLDREAAAETLLDFEKSFQTKELECVNLRSEVAAMREKLLNVQQKYTQTEGDSFDELNKLVVDAHEKMHILQEKYDNLRDAWEEQQTAMHEIQSKYDTVELKYLSLQSEYEELQASSGRTLENRTRLQSENESLQCEINELKERVTEMQKSLLNASAQNDEKAQNTKLAMQLAQERKNYETLQGEYDILSNQLMENIQEEEMLRDQCQILEAKLFHHSTTECELRALKLRNKDFEMEIDALKLKALEANNNNKFEKCLKCHSVLNVSQTYKTDRPIDNRSEDEANPHNAEELLLQFAQVIDKNLYEIEVEEETARSRLYKSQEITADNSPRCKLLIKNIQNVDTFEENSEARTLGNCIHGMLKAQKFVLVETTPTLEQQTDPIDSNRTTNCESAEILEESIKQIIGQNLNTDCNCVEYKALLHAAEQTLHEMRIQIQKLSSELFEKSLSETLAIESLQQDNDKFIQSISTLQKQCEILEHSNNALNIQLQHLGADYEKKLTDTQESYLNVQSQLTSKEENYKNDLNRQQLEFFEKLELNETAFRENLRKYNDEWEKGRVKYECEIECLQKEMQKLQLCCEKSQNTITKLTVTHATEMKQMQEIEQMKKTNETLQSSHESDLRMRDEENNSLKEIIDDQKKQYTVLKEKEKTLGLKMETLLQEVSIAEEKMKHYETLKSELDKTKALLSTASQETRLLNERIESMQSALSKAEQAERVATTVVQSQLAKIAELEHRLQIAQAGTSALVEKINSLQTALSTAKQAEWDATTVIESQLAKIAELEHQLRNAQAEVSAQLEKTNSLGSALSTAEQAERDATTVVESQKTNIADLERQLQNAQEEASGQMVKTNGLESALSTAKQTERDATTLFQSKQGKIAELEHQLRNAQEEASGQMVKTNGLQAALSTAKQNERDAATIVESQKTRIADLELQLQNASAEHTTLSQEKQSLTLQLDGLNAKFLSEQSLLQREYKDLKSSVSELQLKYESVQEANTQLQHENNLLTTNLQTATQNATQSEKELSAQLEDCNILRTLLNTKSATAKEEKFKLEGTISCLMTENKSFEEKLYVAKNTIKKLEDQLSTQSCSRKSFERVIGENHQLQSINDCLENKLSIIQQKPSPSGSIERKNRRLSTHDERRRLSSLWVSTCDRETLTEPFDPNCKCIELDGKLQECEKNLFIRECQVKQLTFEMKHHPLKEANAALMKRLQQEQDKSFNSIKSYKEDIVKLKAEIAALMNRLQQEQDKSFAEIKVYKDDIVKLKAEIAALMKRLQQEQEKSFNDNKAYKEDIMKLKVEISALMKRLQQEQDKSFAEINVYKDDIIKLKAEIAALVKRLQQEEEKNFTEIKTFKENILKPKADIASMVHVEKVSTSVVLNAAVQTDEVVAAGLKELQVKYDELKLICRSRYRNIYELEKKLNAQETSLEVAQMLAIKKQCETLQNELSVVKLKYQNAKVILKERAEKLNRQEAELKKFQPSANGSEQ